jgi:hypothetical protein
MSGVIDAIKAYYPDIKWDLFEDIDRALNWELWHSPLPSNYWTEVEPLEYYTWKGIEQACEDIIEILHNVNETVYIFPDWEGVGFEDPSLDENNYDPESGEWIGEDFRAEPTRKVLMFKETYSQVF